MDKITTSSTEFSPPVIGDFEPSVISAVTAVLGSHIPSCVFNTKRIISGGMLGAWPLYCLLGDVICEAFLWNAGFTVFLLLSYMKLLFTRNGRLIVNKYKHNI